ncbi:hypothetical protein V5O48_018747 [Marasmius crinis-equi]|uniref:Uncharacterized protein n=1 Tax=Marasmius crinis-equi TaxID=585013 RepID=A0ABR3EKA7_9AGAR
MQSFPNNNASLSSLHLPSLTVLPAPTNTPELPMLLSPIVVADTPLAVSGSNFPLVPPGLGIPQVDVTPAELSYPYATPKTRDEFMTIIDHSDYDEETRQRIRAIIDAITHLQLVVDEKDQDIERLKRDFTVASARVEVHKRLTDIHKNGSTEHQRKATELQEEVSLLKKETEGLNHKIRELLLQNRENQITIAALLRKLQDFAREALRGRRANAILMFPDLRKGLRSIRFEVLATSARLNVAPRSPRDDDLYASVNRALKVVDDTVKLLNDIEIASREVVGDLSDTSAWDKRVRRAVRGIRIESIKEAFTRLRGRTSPTQRPFTVNPAPIHSFLGQPSPGSSMMSISDSPSPPTPNSSGLSMADVSNWRDNVFSA